MKSTVPAPQDELQKIRYAAFQGNLKAIARYLEKGGDPNVQFTGTGEESDLLKEAMAGYDAYEHFHFGEPAIQNAEEGEALLINIAKMLVASGFQIHEQRHILSEMKQEKGKLFQHKDALLVYLRNVFHGRVDVPTEESLQADGVLLDLTARRKHMEHQRFVEEEAQRVKNGIVLNPDALRGEDILPKATLGVPLKTDGKISSGPQKNAAIHWI